MRQFVLIVIISLLWGNALLHGQVLTKNLQWFAVAQTEVGMAGEDLPYRSLWRKTDTITIQGAFPVDWKCRILVLSPKGHWLIAEPEVQTPTVQWKGGLDSPAGDYTAWLIFSVNEAELQTQEFLKSLENPKRPLGEALVWLRKAQWADIRNEVVLVPVPFSGSIRSSAAVEAHVKSALVDTPLVVVRYDFTR